MGSFMKVIAGFISQVITLALAGSFLPLVAGEIRLVALKKASQGLTKLSGFTQKMTGKSLNF